MNDFSVCWIHVDVLFCDSEPVLSFGVGVYYRAGSADDFAFSCKALDPELVVHISICEVFWEFLEVVEDV